MNFASAWKRYRRKEHFLMKFEWIVKWTSVDDFFSIADKGKGEAMEDELIKIRGNGIIFGSGDTFPRVLTRFLSNDPYFSSQI